MARQEFCDSCKQKNDCRKVYDQLGGVEGPSVTVKVILAFLLPLVVFILFLAAFEKILAKAIGTSHGLTAASLLVALLASLACIMMTGIIRRKLGQGR